MIDSHCHLDFPQFQQCLPEVVARAQAAGVAKMLTICTRLDRFDQVVGIVEAHDSLYMGLGVHPHEAGAHGLTGSEALLALAKHEKVVGIGETGLDFFYDHAPRAQQEVSFRAHIQAARVSGLPLIVHTRDAEADTIRILQDEARAGAFPGLIHCFTGTADLRDAALELGLYISVSGIATFKKSTQLRETLAAVPLNRLLIETDAPYLAPAPHRGKTNEPAFVVHTAAALAETFGLPLEEFAQATTDNFHRLFRRVPT